MTFASSRFAVFLWAVAILPSSAVAQCLQTPDSETITRAGQGAVVPMGPPMVLTGMGTELRRSVALVLHDTREPWMTVTTDWRPAKPCVL